jgi:hypothetical protein
VGLLSAEPSTIELGVLKFLNIFDGFNRFR